MKTRAPITLLDGDAQHKRYPKTFWMPPMAERQALQEGDRVKLMFEGEPMAERMWVSIDWRDPEGNFYGTLLGAPLFLESLDYGDEVFFSPCHVIDIERAEAA
jgi:hypothetical protein